MREPASPLREPLAPLRGPDPEEAPDIGIGDDILVADDSPTNLVAIESALSPLGRHIVTVSSGVDALAKLLEQDFALIVLDVAMPGITGIETARMIRSRPRSRGTPIVFVTGMAWQDNAVDEAYEAGGFDFLVKPVRAEVLRAKVRVFLKLQERTRALRRQEEALRISQARLYEHELHEQRQRFESELLDARLQQLAEVDRGQQQLAGIIGNELLNPLQTLQMAFDLLREHPNAEKGERICSLVEHRLVHVTRLVKILIDVARVAAGQLELHLETVNITEVVAQALGECRSVVDTRKLRVRFEAENAPVPLVTGDPIRLHQALTTLIDQAAHATAEGGEIIISSRVLGGDVVVRVTDSGRGIAAAQISRTFDMFVGDGLAQGVAALNLGLTLVKRLVDLHDGSIRVTSDGVGKGSTFEIRLALAPQDVELASMDLYASQEVMTFSPSDLYASQEMSITADSIGSPTLQMAAVPPPPDDSDEAEVVEVAEIAEIIEVPDVEDPAEAAEVAEAAEHAAAGQVGKAAEA
ncbi:MAG: response regulator [Myxococcales bacterium]|nr:response regulator [Myxococcales bacterium]